VLAIVEVEGRGRELEVSLALPGVPVLSLSGVCCVTGNYPTPSPHLDTGVGCSPASKTLLLLLPFGVRHVLSPHLFHFLPCGALSSVNHHSTSRIEQIGS
jgi:hypothetical protein